MKALLLYSLLVIGIACGSKSSSNEYEITVKELSVTENGQRWDFLNWEPELYYVFKAGTQEHKSTPSFNSSWSHSNVNDTFSFSLTNPVINISVYDDDFGGADDKQLDLSDPINSLFDNLIEDSDDLVLSEKVELSGSSGNMLVENSAGNIFFAYRKI